MDLQHRIENYRPSSRVIEAVRAARIALLVGITGAGKDTIKRGLLALPGFGDIVSHTTRSPRYNRGELERDGVDYYFIGEAQAKTMLDEGAFIEAKFVHGTVYGTTLEALVRATERGVAITDVDVQGVEEYKAISADVVAIFVVPPDYQTWISRLRSRYDDEDAFMAEWPQRKASAVRELGRALSMPYYHFVINDDIDRATQASREIAEREDIFNRKDDEARLAARDLLQAIAAETAI